MGNDEFLKIAVEEVRRYTDEQLEDPQGYDVYVVWVCKTLQNNKALLSTADVAYFLKGWNTARGCRIEYMCADNYGIGAYFEED